MTARITLRRWAGLFGIGWFILFAVGTIVLQGQSPAYDQPLAEVRQFFQDHGGRYLVGDYLADVAFVLLFLPFAACLRSLLAAAGAHTETLARLVLTGAVVMVVVGGTATAFLDAVAPAVAPWMIRRSARCWPPTAPRSRRSECPRRCSRSLPR